MDMAGCGQLRSYLWILKHIRQSYVGAVIGKKRSILPRRRADCNTRGFAGIEFQTRAIDPEGFQPLNDGGAVRLADAPEDSNFNPELRKPAGGDSGSAPYLASKFASKRLLAELRK